MKPNKKYRYSGVDARNWKVVTHQGQELRLFKTVFNEEANKFEKISVTRWDGFKTANAVAQKLGGVAVRA